MLYLALVFFIVAIIAAFFGFGSVTGALTSLAQVFFFLFLALFVISLLAGLFSRKGPKSTS